jgi:hypothetical protein
MECGGKRSATPLSDCGATAPVVGETRYIDTEMLSPQKRARNSQQILSTFSMTSCGRGNCFCSTRGL